MGKKRCYHGLEPCYLKFLRKMKLTILVLLLSVFASWATPGYSQTNLLSLEAKNITLEDFLRKIEDQSEFRFFYSGRIDIEKSVSGVFENKSIKEVLDAVLKKVDIKYELKGRQIILSPSDFSVSSGQQQKSISGKVNDTSGAPLPGVSVVIAGTSNGTVTDANGNY